ncbi:MAG: hypothetical protein EGP89_01645 [Ruminococcaceae bacterium]|nr:hypothetical protein [Oscillospiraceae bacterium]
MTGNDITKRKPARIFNFALKMRAGFALLSTGIFRIRFAGDTPAANLTHRPKIFSQISQNACNLSKKSVCLMSRVFSKPREDF